MFYFLFKKSSKYELLFYYGRCVHIMQAGKFVNVSWVSLNSLVGLGVGYELKQRFAFQQKQKIF
jgi:hypothetical protein